MSSSFTNLKDLIVERARKLPGGHALESAYVVKIIKKELEQFFNIPEGTQDFTKITYFKGIVHLTVSSASFANELKNHEKSICDTLKKSLPTADFTEIRVKIG